MNIYYKFLKLLPVILLATAAAASSQKPYKSLEQMLAEQETDMKIYQKLQEIAAQKGQKGTARQGYLPLHVFTTLKNIHSIYICADTEALYKSDVKRSPERLPNGKFKKDRNGKIIYKEEVTARKITTQFVYEETANQVDSEFKFTHTLPWRLKKDLLLDEAAFMVDIAFKDKTQLSGSAHFKPAEEPIPVKAMFLTLTKKEDEDDLEIKVGVM